jgi:hypothetical protein
MPETDLPIIGRELMQADKLTKLLLDATGRKHNVRPATSDRRGFHYEVELLDPDRKTTNRVARVTVEIVPFDEGMAMLNPPLVSAVQP